MLFGELFEVLVTVRNLRYLACCLGCGWVFGGVLFGVLLG